MLIVAEQASRHGVAPTCRALGLSRATWYRRRQPSAPRQARGVPRKLPDTERQTVLEVLHEPRFIDQSPPEVHANLLDEGRYLCSLRTMYRILAEKHEVRERRALRRHPCYTAPELLARRPNELWSWDITKLLGPHKWTYFYLYVILDVFSRYVVGWLLAHCESQSLATRLIAATIKLHGIVPGQLTIHADRGSSMKSKPVALMMSDLGVTKTHSRPHVSNDNPYSEAQFKTMKYRPGFPERFGSLCDARAHCGDFFPWYNNEHHHGGLSMLTPNDVHFGLAEMRLAQRADVLAAAYAKHPERFPLGLPRPQALPTEVWINKPTTALAARIMGTEMEGEAPGCARTSDHGLFLGSPENGRSRELVAVL
jgi:putative transposase